MPRTVDQAVQLNILPNLYEKKGKLQFPDVHWTKGGTWRTWRTPTKTQSKSGGHEHVPIMFYKCHML